MDEQVKAAVERWRASGVSPESDEEVYPIDGPHKASMDAATLADWAVDRLAADAQREAERGQAVTREWLQTLGGIDNVGAILIDLGNGSSLAVEDDFSVGIQRGDYNDPAGKYHSVPLVVKTRGQVHDLISAFGVPATDSGKGSVGK